MIKRVIICAGACAVFCALLLAAATIYVVAKAKSRIIDPAAAGTVGADCILVLGAKVYGESPSGILKDSLDAAIELYNAGAAPKLLMSGDHGEVSYDELYAMKKYALESGVPSCDVFCDHAGFNTYNSLARAKVVFGCERIIVVTQEFHISRAIFLGQAVGLDIYGVTSDRSPDKTANYVREAFARVKAVYDAAVLPEPRFTGETIPISGDGRVTDDKSFE